MPPCDDCGRRLCLGNCPRRVKERSATSTAGIVKPTLAAQTTAESEASVPADVPSRPVHPRDFGMLSWHEHRTGRPHPDEFTQGSPISPAVVVQRDADGNLRHVDIYLEDGSPPRYPPGFAPGDLDQYGPSFQVSRRRVRVGRPVPPPRWSFAHGSYTVHPELSPVTDELTGHLRSMRLTGAATPRSLGPALEGASSEPSSAEQEAAHTVPSVLKDDKGETTGAHEDEESDARDDDLSDIDDFEPSKAVHQSNRTAGSSAAESAAGAPEGMLHSSAKSPVPFASTCRRLLLPHARAQTFAAADRLRCELNTHTGPAIVGDASCVFWGSLAEKIRDHCMQ